MQQSYADDEEQNERRAAESMDHSWMPLQSTPTNTRDACMHRMASQSKLIRLQTLSDLDIVVAWTSLADVHS
jgi:hypothetical protein